MTEPTNHRKIDRNSAISLGLACAMSLGAVTFAMRIPTSDTMELIVYKATKPIEEKLNAVIIEQAGYRNLEERVRALEEKARGG